jgi:LEA14-like dessication related protein
LVMKKAIKITGIILALLILTGAAAVLIIPREKLITYLTPEVKYVTVTNAVITDSTAIMDVQLNVTSSILPVYVDSLAYDFRLYNQSVAKGNQKFSPDSKSGNLQKLIIPVTVEHNKARELVRRQVAEGEKLEARVEAYCRFPFIGIRRIDINRNVDMTIPVLPGANIVASQTLP